MPNSSWSLLFDCDHLCKWAISSYMASFTDSVIFIGVFYASKWQYFFCLRLAVCSRWTHRYFVDSAYHKSIDTKYICCAFIFMISAFSFFFFATVELETLHYAYVHTAATQHICRDDDTHNLDCVPLQHWFEYVLITTGRWFYMLCGLRLNVILFAVHSAIICHLAMNVYVMTVVAFGMPNDSGRVLWTGAHIHWSSAQKQKQNNTENAFRKLLTPLFYIHLICWVEWWFHLNRIQK